MSENSEIEYVSFWARLFKRFSKKRKIKKDDVGIYKYIYVMDSVGENSRYYNRYNIFTKIKAVHVYEEMVEVQLMDFHVNEPITEDVSVIIKKNFPKYIDPSSIQWEIEK